MHCNSNATQFSTSVNNRYTDDDGSYCRNMFVKLKKVVLFPKILTLLCCLDHLKANWKTLEDSTQMDWKLESSKQHFFVPWQNIAFSSKRRLFLTAAHMLGLGLPEAFQNLFWIKQKWKSRSKLHAR